MNSLQWLPSTSCEALIDNRIVFDKDAVVYDDEELIFESDMKFKLQTPNWGAKATQVQTIGKHNIIKNDPVLEIEIGSPQYAFRHDEEYFSIQKSNRLYIFNEDGQLYSKYDQDIAYSICWYKHRVLTFQRRRRKLMGVFVEPNGLEHGTFIIPFPNYYVYKVKVNEDQSILFMQLNHLTENKSLLTCWICMNAEWYISSTIDITNIDWYVNENDLNFVCNDRKLALQPQFKVISEKGIVCVINGSKVYVTDTCTASMPPPYCHIIIECDEELIDCCFIDDCFYGLSRASLYTHPIDKVTGFNKIQKCSSKKELAQSILIGSFCLSDVIVVYSRDFTSLLITKNKAVEHPYCITAIKTPEMILFGINTIYASKDINISFKVVKVRFINNCYYMQSIKGDLYQYKSQFIKITNKCSSFDCIQINGLDFLIVTTTTDMLIIYNMSNLDLMYERPIERGSIIVSLVRLKVNLQLPRGNLETIEPRPFVIQSIVTFINEKHIKEAVELARVHRIDFNILFDLNLFSIEEMCKLLVSQCNNNRLNLILTSLNNLNCLNALYKEEAFLLSLKSDKILKSTICSSMRSALDERYGKDISSWPLNSLQTFVTTFMRDGQIFEALKVVKQILSTDLLTYCIFLSDKATLFKIAHEFYDLEFLEFVGRQCGIDPAVYNELIANAHNMPEHQLKYTLDMEIEEYGRAAIHLLEKSSIEEIMGHINKYKSFKQPILYMIKNEPLNCWNPIWKAYASHLFDKNHKIPSAVAYYLGNQNNKALELFLENKYYIEALQCGSIEEAVEVLDILDDFDGILKITMLSKLTKEDALAAKFNPFIHYTITNDSSCLVELQKNSLIEVNEFEQKIKYFTSNLKECRALMEDKLLQLEQEDLEFDDVASVGSIETSRSTVFTQITGLSKITFKTAKTRKTRKKVIKKGTIQQETILIEDFGDLILYFNRKMREWEEIHCQLFMSRLFNCGIEFYKAVYSCYSLLAINKKEFELSMYNKQMMQLSRNNNISKMDLAEYACSIHKAKDIPDLCRKPMWLHFQ